MDRGPCSDAKVSEERERAVARANDSILEKHGITRRGFVLSAVATAALGAGVASAQSIGWSWEFEPDPEMPGRRIFTISHPELKAPSGDRSEVRPSKFGLVLPEVAFGETARVSIFAIESREGGLNPGGQIDFCAMVSGATLLDPKTANDVYFDIGFHFYNRIPRQNGSDPSSPPSVDIFLNGWLFGANSFRGKGLLAAQKVSIAELKSARNRPLVLKSLPNSVTATMCNALFGSMLIAPYNFMQLSICPIFGANEVFYWLLSSTKNDPDNTKNLFFVPLAPVAQAKRDAKLLAKTAAVVSPLLRISRNIQKLDRKAESQDSSSEGAEAATVAELMDARPGTDRLVLAEYLQNVPYGNGIICPVLSDYQLTSAPRIIRRLNNNLERVIEVEFEVDGRLDIATSSTVRPDSEPYVEGRIPIHKGPIRLLRNLEKNSALQLFARLVVDTKKEFSLPTAFGVFTAGSPEPKIKQPPQGGLGESFRSERAPVVIKAKDWRTLEHFECTLLVVGASVNLPDSKSESLNQSRRHFCRLDFPRGTEVIFRLFGLHEAERADSATGRVCFGIVTMLAKELAYSPASYSLPMENSHLQVIRGTDLVALKFRFLGLDLVKEGANTLLKPRGAAKPALLTAAAYGAEELAPPLSGPVHDPRPMMIVELPPQHRGEQTFFERRAIRPEPPRFPDFLRENPDISRIFQDLNRLYVVSDDLAAENQAAIERTRLRAMILAGLLKDKNVLQDKNVSDFLLTAKGKALLELANSEAIKMLEPVDKQIPALVEFVRFAIKFYVDSETTNLPQEQRLYVGREFLDPDGIRQAEISQNAVIEKKHALDPLSALLQLVEEMPVDPIGQGELQDLLSKWKTDEFASAAKKLREDRSPAFNRFAEKFNDLNVPAFSEPNDLSAVVAAYYPSDKGLQTFEGRDNLRNVLVALRMKAKTNGNLPDNTDELILEEWAERLVKSIHEAGLVELPRMDGQFSNKSDREKIGGPVRSRLSGPSRLAFRINTDDYETGGDGGAIPFTLDDLTNWSRFELSVVRRAQKLFRTYRDGTQRPAWDREEDIELADMLVHQGFSRGGELKLLRRDPDAIEAPKEDEDFLWESTAKKRNWGGELVTVEQRLAEVVRNATEPPSLTETAIEMPFRLILSPSQDGVFRTPRGVPEGLYSTMPEVVPFMQGPAIPLWLAELDTASKAHVRAVWSPDFRPEAFLARPARQDDRILDWFFPRRKTRVNRSPIRGSFAPWATGRQLSSSDLAQASTELKDLNFRTSLDAFDRHELVALSSLHGLPVMGKVSLAGRRIGVNQKEPPPGFRVAVRGQPAFDDYEPGLTDYNDIYVAPPLNAKELLGKDNVKPIEIGLTSLGGYLSVDASFEPPAPIVDYKGNALFDALSIEQWRHRIVLGRDISAEVVYKGYLMPLGVRAALVKSTSRVFERITATGGPVAVLRQRMFIRVAKPDKTFAAFRQPDEGRRIPFTKARIVTTTTPDLVDPFDLSGVKVAEASVWPGGLIDLVSLSATESPDQEPRNLSGTPFWPRTARRSSGEVIFEVEFDDTVRVRMPMVFVDNVTANNRDSLATLCSYYNNLSSPSKKSDPTVQRNLVSRPVFGQRLTYAPSLKDGDTQFPTDLITFAVEGLQPSIPAENVSIYDPLEHNNRYYSDAFLQGADQPPFYPAMRSCIVRVPQIARLTGRLTEPVEASYDSRYAKMGFDAAGTPTSDLKNRLDIFLALLESRSLAFGKQGDKGGAVGRPEIDVWGLSRSRGPVGFSPVGTKVEPKPKDGDKTHDRGLPVIGDQLKNSSISDFFSGKAKLLGVVSFKDLLSFLLKKTGSEPKLQEITEYASGLGDDADQYVRNNVLIPVRDVLRRFRAHLRGLQYYSVVGGNPKVVNGEDALKLLYPDIDASLLAFEKAIDVAIAAPPPSQDLENSFSSYSEVYGSGREFLEATRRVARDPLTPLREAFRRGVETLVGEFTKAVEEARSKLQSLFKEESINNHISLRLQDLLLESQAVNVLATPLAKLILRVENVVKAESETPEADLQTELAGVLNGYLQKITDPKLGEKNSCHLLTALKIAAQASSQDRVKAFLEKLQSLAPLPDSNNFLSGGPLFGVFLNVAVTFAQMLVVPFDAAKTRIEEVAKTLSEAGAAIGEAVGVLHELSVLAEGVNDQCKMALELANSYIQAIIPVDRLANEAPKWVTEPSQKNCETLIDASGTSDAPLPLIYQVGGHFIRAYNKIQELKGKIDQFVESESFKAFEKTPDIPQQIASLVRVLSQEINRAVPQLAVGKSPQDQALRILRRIHRLANEYVEAFSLVDANCNFVDETVQRAMAACVNLNAERIKLLKLLTGEGVLGDRIDTHDRSIASSFLALFNAAAPETLPGSPLAPIVRQQPNQSFPPDPTGNPGDWKWTERWEAAENDLERIDALDDIRREFLGIVLPVLASLGTAVASMSTIAATKINDAKKLLLISDGRAGDFNKFLEELRKVLNVAGHKAIEEYSAKISDLLKILKAEKLTDVEKSRSGALAMVIEECKALALEQAGTFILTFGDSANELWDQLLSTPLGDSKQLKIIVSQFGRVRDMPNRNLVKDLGDCISQKIIGEARDATSKYLDNIEAAYEQKISNLLFAVVSGANKIAQDIVDKTVSAAVEPSLGVLAELFTGSLEVRRVLFDNIKDPTGNSIPDEFIKQLNGGLRRMLLACPTDADSQDSDQLAKQAKNIEEIKAKLSSDIPNTRQEAIEQLVDLVGNWKSAIMNGNACPATEEGPFPNPILLVLSQVANTVAEAARGDFAKLIDVDVFRKLIEQKLRELIPSRITLAYDFDTEIEKPVAGIFIPAHSKNGVADVQPDPGEPDCRLTLKARTTIDVLNGGKPSVYVSGEIGSFAIRLVGSVFDVCTLRFSGAKYGNDTGGKLKTAIRDVKLGKMVEFLDQFSQYFSFGDQGFFINYRWDLPGIEAGYRMPPIYLTFGGLNISNLSLNASCILPFDDGEAIFKIGLSRPEAPFSITSTVFGGAGHLALYSSASGIIGFTCSLEFGAIVDFKLGPVTGRGQVTAGVYIRSLKMGDQRVSTVDGVFTAAGSANISMFRVSAMLQVRVGQQPSGGVAGSATFVYSFSLGVKDIEFKFVIYKQEKKGMSGGGLSADASNVFGRATRFASADSNHVLPSDNSNKWQTWAVTDQCGPGYLADVSCKGESFKKYKEYFSEVDPWMPV